MRSLSLSILTPRRLLVAVVVLGAVLRFYHLETLSLWLDEGITVYWSKKPWPIVLGVRDYASTHPPLYYALVKLVAYVVPDTLAGRMISALAGIATIPILYFLVARLTRSRAGLVASLMLAASPVHIWYSQEARMYALEVFLVALSYLALVAYYQRPQAAWAIAYGFSLLLAMYTDYSAIYALAPQVIVLSIVIWKRRRQGLALIAAVVLAAIGYLPWLSRLFSTVQAVGDVRDDYLGITPARFVASLRSIIGFDGNPDYFYSADPTPWDRWPAWHVLLVMVLTSLIILGIVVLARRSYLGLFVAIALSGSTLAIATLITVFVSPGYAERTILSVTLGLAFLIGAAYDIRPPRWVAALGMIGALGLLVISALTLHIIYTSAIKQDWKGLAAEAATLHNMGIPLVTYPTLATTFMTIYEPQATQNNYVGIDDGQFSSTTDLDETLAFTAQDPVVVLAYLDTDGVSTLQAQLLARGYEQLMHHYFAAPLYVDLWARPTASIDLGANLLPPLAADTGQGLNTWQLAGQSSLIENGSAFRVAPTGQTVDVRLTTQQVRPGHYYLLEFSSRNADLSGEQRVYVSTHNSAGAWLDIFPTGAGYLCPKGANWANGRFAFLVPPETTSLTVWLRGIGTGTADFSGVELRELK
ncbi:MAG TPA: glycosyltransferase family 39 protein [Thermomicrobiales bacterium]|nr:glycosyltransferase family 39 protein [Thermomicrobiales bacterium]